MYTGKAMNIPFSGRGNNNKSKKTRNSDVNKARIWSRCMPKFTEMWQQPVNSFMLHRRVFGFVVILRNCERDWKL
jgi:hypothetical protein